MSNLIFSKEFPNGWFEIYHGTPDFSFIEATQVHKNIVIPWSQAQTNPSLEADGLYSTDNEFPPLAIKTADCLPILILGKKGVAMLHAGWRGVHQEIFLTKEIQELKPTFYFIGPHIQKESFQVTPEFKDHFPESLDFFHEKENKLTFSLADQVKKRMKESFPQIQGEVSSIDTVSDLKFCSYRRDNTAKRNYNIYRARYND
jgi:polyphenol oxidase